MILQKFVQRIKKKGFRYTFLRVLRRIASDYSMFPVAYYFQRAFKGYAQKRINGYIMYLDLKNDSGISRDLYIYRKREHNTTDFLLNSRLIEEGDVVLDIGANIGYYALLWSKLVGPKGIVYALEPVSSNFAILEKNVQLNNARNIHIYKLAAGGTNEKRTITVYSQANLSSFMTADVKNYQEMVLGQEEVEVTTVDDFLGDRQVPKLVRMDVEGYESEVVKGMINTLEKISYLLIELHPNLMSKKQKMDMYSILKNKSFTYGIVFYEHLKWLTKNGNIKSLIRFVDKTLGEEKIQIKKFSGEKNLYAFFQEREETPHLLLSKTPIWLQL